MTSQQRTILKRCTVEAIERGYGLAFEIPYIEYHSNSAAWIDLTYSKDGKSATRRIDLPARDANTETEIDLREIVLLLIAETRKE